jgi:hypothetical protein
VSIKIKGDNGVRVSVEDIGSKNGKPVVFIHDGLSTIICIMDFLI